MSFPFLCGSWWLWSQKGAPISLFPRKGAPNPPSLGELSHRRENGASVTEPNRVTRGLSSPETAPGLPPTEDKSRHPAHLLCPQKLSRP